MHFTAAFIALLATATASPIKGAEHPQPGISTRQDDPNGEWAGFHKLSETFQKTGNCRIYSDPRSTRDGKWPCYEYCKTIGQEGGALGCFAPNVFKEGTTELRDPTWEQQTPDGEKFIVGECICSTAAKDKIAEIAGEVMIILGQQACATWLEAIKTSISLIGSTPSPGGAIAGSIKALAKIVSRIASVDSISGADKFKEFVQDTCGAEDWAKIDFKAAFDYLKDVKL